VPSSRAGSQRALPRLLSWSSLSYGRELGRVGARLISTLGRSEIPFAGLGGDSVSKRPKRTLDWAKIHEHVPGHWEFRLDVYQEGDPRYDELLLDPEVLPPGPPIPPALEGRRRRDAGYSLAEMRERIGGEEGYLVHPETGQRDFVSLKPWANADPEKTRCYPGYWFVPEKGHEEKYQALTRRHLKDKRDHHE
jgi:hypothetical protein